jgi:putative transposase
MRPKKGPVDARREWFNGRWRDKCLNVCRFLPLEHAREQIEHWAYRLQCPTSTRSLGDLIPSEFVERSQTNRPSAVI